MLIGGVGYVGYNLALYHISRGEGVLVVSRPTSLSRRPGIVKGLRRAGAEVAVTASPRDYMALLEKRGCPQRVYILVGRLRGPQRQLYDSNVATVLAYAESTLTACRETLLIYASALAVYGKGAPSRCGVPLRPHQPPCRCCAPTTPYAISKLEAERRLHRLVDGLRGRLLIARMGLFAGRRPYHAEWRMLLSITAKGVVPASNAYLYLSTAASLAALADKKSPAQGAVAVHAVSLTTTLESLAEALVDARGVRLKVRLPLPGERTAKLLDRLRLPGILRDILWSAYTKIEPDMTQQEALEDVAELLLAEPPMA